MSHRAHAFGGLWSSRGAPVKQSAEQIVFVDNPDSTVTAIIQMRYVGASQKFAWVIPMPGTPTVGVSSNTVFQRLDAATAPQYWLEVGDGGLLPDGGVAAKCIQQDDSDAALDAGAATDGSDATAPVSVMDQGSVGPYDYVNIKVDPNLSDPSKVATRWLTTNGYDLTRIDGTVLRPYLKDGLNLLAFKLSDGKDVGAVRPVILTYESKLPMIPIRPTAVAAQDHMGIQVWVIGPSQAVPDNYKSLVINDALIDWLTAQKYVNGTLPAGGAGPFGPKIRKPSNYDAIVIAAAHEAGGQGFVTELGGPASQYRDKVWSALDDQQVTTISKQSYADGIDAILTANSSFGSWDGWKDAILGATTLPAGVAIDEFGRNPERYRGVAKVDTAKFFHLLDTTVIKPVADTAAMLYRAPYLTRLYGTMSSNEMTVDPAFNYNSDIAQENSLNITKKIIKCIQPRSEVESPWPL
jgi:hypothetical protein